MSAAPLLPERFRLLRKLGEGGMGVVYEAFDEERSERVAVKTLRDLTADSLARFKREFRALADVHHPSVVTLGELFSEGREWFFSMELVEGEDFLEYVRPAAGLRAIESPAGASLDALAVAPTVPFARSDAGGRFDEARLRAAMRQLSGALTTLHAAGIAHRDLKPSNIRVTAEGRLVVLDFGLAADLARDRPSTVGLSGTPAYMAPEQATASAVGPEADWYAVGVLLYEALTGTLPFVGTALQMMMMKQSQTPAPPGSLVPDVPADLDALCVALLRYDPKARPTGAAVQRAFGDAVVPAGNGSPGSFADGTPFVGRAEELEALRTAFHDSREQRAPVSVLLEGESGVGKSCLVRRFLATLAAEEPNLVVLAGRCFEREAVPYKALDGVVDALANLLVRDRGSLAGQVLPMRAGALTQVFPVLRRVDAFANVRRPLADTSDPVELRGRAFAAMRETLTRLATIRPCVITIDDLHWADADSLALLGEIMRAPEAPPLLLVATVRTSSKDSLSSRDSSKESLSTEKGGILQRIVAVTLEGRVRTIPMARMPEDDACALASRLLEREASMDARGAPEIAREAGGHRLFIDALVRHVAIAGTRASGSRLEDALWARVAALDPGPQRAMQILAVAGKPITQEVLADALGGDRAELGRHVSLLRVAHLASITGARASDTIEPYHDRVRAAVVANLAPDVLAACHRALALALERAPRRDTEALLRHWREAGDPALAAQYAALAGDEAGGALAFDRAAVLYETALELGSAQGAARSTLLEKLGDALASAGRGSRAAEAYVSAAEGARGARSFELQRRSADQLLRVGHIDEGLAAIERVLAGFGLQAPRTKLGAVVRFLVDRALLAVRGLGFRARDASEIAASALARVDACISLAFTVGLVDSLWGAVYQARGLRLALECGERGRIARALAGEAVYVSVAGARALRRTEALLTRCHALAAECGDPVALAWAQLASGLSYYLLGKTKLALEYMERAHDLWCVIPGSLWELDTLQVFATNARVDLGLLARVARETPVALRDAEQRGNRYAVVSLSLTQATIAFLAVEGSEPTLARVNEAIASWSKRGFHLEHFFAFMACAEALAYGGRAAEAHALIESNWPALQRSMLPFIVQAVRVRSYQVRARMALRAAEASEGEAFARLLSDAERCARRLDREKTSALASPFAALIRAGLASTRRRGEALTASLLREAIAGFDALEMALYAAAARRRLGEVVGGDEGRALVRGADAWMKSESVGEPERMTVLLAPGFVARP
jgi:tetratricopeptide (TPR) repeat protein